MNPKLKALIIDFDSIAVGDDVWHLIENKYVTITRIKDDEYFPIKCACNQYSKTGFSEYKQGIPILWKSNPFDLISEYPKEMMVSDNQREWNRKFVVYEDKEYTCSYLDNNGSFWQYAKEIEPKKEITLAQLCKEAGYDINNVIVK